MQASTEHHTFYSIHSPRNQIGLDDCLEAVLQNEAQSWNMHNIEESMRVSAEDEESLGSTILKHGNAVRNIHGYFSNLEFRKCCMNLVPGYRTTFSNMMRLVKPNEHVPSEATATFAKTAKVRRATELNQQEALLFRHALLCAQYPQLCAPKPPTTPMSPTIKTFSFNKQPLPSVIIEGIAAETSDNEETSSLIQPENLYEHLRAAFCLSIDAVQFQERKLKEAYGKKSLPKVLVEELVNQLSVLENNRHPFYNPKNFMSRNGYDLWQQAERNHIMQLISKFWGFSLPPPSGSQVADLQSKHEDYRLLLSKLVRYDNTGRQPGHTPSMQGAIYLSQSSQRLLKEFALRYGIGELYQRIIYLQHLAEQYDSDAKYIRHVYETLAYIRALLPSSKTRVVMVKHEYDILLYTIAWLHDQTGNFLNKMKRLYPENKPAEAVACLINLLSSLLEIESYLTEKKQKSTTEWLHYYIEKSFETSYERHKFIAASQLNLDPLQLSPKLLNVLLLNIRDEVTDYRQNYQSTFAKYFDISGAAARSFYEYLMVDVISLCHQRTEDYHQNEIDLLMVSLAYRLHQLDCDWSDCIPTEFQTWRPHFAKKGLNWLDVLSGHLQKLVLQSVGTDKYEVLQVKSEILIADKGKRESIRPGDRTYHPHQVLGGSLVSLNTSSHSAFKTHPAQNKNAEKSFPPRALSSDSGLNEIHGVQDSACHMTPSSSEINCISQQRKGTQSDNEREVDKPGHVTKMFDRQQLSNGNAEVMNRHNVSEKGLRSEEMLIEALVHCDGGSLGSSPLNPPPGGMQSEACQTNGFAKIEVALSETGSYDGPGSARFEISSGSDSPFLMSDYGGSAHVEFNRPRVTSCPPYRASPLTSISENSSQVDYNIHRVNSTKSLSAIGNDAHKVPNINRVPVRKLKMQRGSPRSPGNGVTGFLKQFLPTSLSPTNSTDNLLVFRKGSLKLKHSLSTPSLYKRTMSPKVNMKHKRNNSFTQSTSVGQYDELFRTSSNKSLISAIEISEDLISNEARKELSPYLSTSDSFHNTFDLQSGDNQEAKRNGFSDIEDKILHSNIEGTADTNFKHIPGADIQVTVLSVNENIGFEPAGDDNNNGKYGGKSQVPTVKPVLTPPATVQDKVSADIDTETFHQELMHNMQDLPSQTEESTCSNYQHSTDKKDSTQKSIKCDNDSANFDIPAPGQTGLVHLVAGNRDILEKDSPNKDYHSAELDKDDEIVSLNSGNENCTNISSEVTAEETSVAETQDVSFAEFQKDDDDLSSDESIDSETEFSFVENQFQSSYPPLQVVSRLANSRPNNPLIDRQLHNENINDDAQVSISSPLLEEEDIDFIAHMENFSGFKARSPPPVSVVPAVSAFTHTRPDPQIVQTTSHDGQTHRQGSTSASYADRRQTGSAQITDHHSTSTISNDGSLADSKSAVTPVCRSPRSQSTQTVVSPEHGISSLIVSFSGSTVDLLVLMERLTVFAETLCSTLCPMPDEDFDSSVFHQLENINEQHENQGLSRSTSARHSSSQCSPVTLPKRSASSTYHLASSGSQHLSEELPEQHWDMHDIAMARNDIHNKIVQTLQDVFHIYADNMVCMDICATPREEAHRLLGNEVVKHLMDLKSHGLIWGCRHMIKPSKDCYHFINNDAELLADRFEPITQEVESIFNTDAIAEEMSEQTTCYHQLSHIGRNNQMCTRINNLTSLLDILPKFQRKIADAVCLDSVNDILEEAKSCRSTPYPTSDRSAVQSPASQDFLSLPSRKSAGSIVPPPGPFNVCVVHVKTAVSSLLKILAYKVNLFLHEALNLLLYLEIPLDTPVEDRLRPLSDFLTGHLTATSEWLCQSSFRQFMDNLWMLMVENFEQEVDQLKRCNVDTEIQAEIMLKAIAFLIKFMNNDDQGLSLEQLMARADNVLFYLQLYTHPTNKLLALYYQILAVHSGLETNNLNLSELPPREYLEKMRHELHSVRKCFSGRQLIDWMLDNQIEQEDTSELSGYISPSIIHSKEHILGLAQTMLDKGLLVSIDEDLVSNEGGYSTKYTYPLLTEDSRPNSGFVPHRRIRTDTETSITSAGALHRQQAGPRISLDSIPSLSGSHEEFQEKRNIMDSHDITSDADDHPSTSQAYSAKCRPRTTSGGNLGDSVQLPSQHHGSGPAAFGRQRNSDGGVGNLKEQLESAIDGASPVDFRQHRAQTITPETSGYKSATSPIISDRASTPSSNILSSVGSDNSNHPQHFYCSRHHFYRFSSIQDDNSNYSSLKKANLPEFIERFRLYHVVRTQIHNMLQQCREKNITPKFILTIVYTRMKSDELAKAFMQMFPKEVILDLKDESSIFGCWA